MIDRALGNSEKGKRSSFEMPTDYDPNVLQQYADQLYSQAKWIVFWMALTYGLFFLVIGFLAVVGVALLPLADASLANAANPALLSSVLVGLTAVGIFMGVDAGRRKSFNLKLHAQQLLCQRKIELNTRTAG
jgi:hypothetical protein